MNTLRKNVASHSDHHRTKRQMGGWNPVFSLRNSFFAIKISRISIVLHHLPVGPSKIDLNCWNSSDGPHNGLKSAVRLEKCQPRLIRYFLITQIFSITNDATNWPVVLSNRIISKYYEIYSCNPDDQRTKKNIVCRETSENERKTFINDLRPLFI